MWAGLSVVRKKHEVLEKWAGSRKERGGVIGSRIVHNGEKRGRSLN